MNKAQLKSVCCSILNSYSRGMRLSTDHEQFLLNDILPRHPHYDEKLGCGIDYIFVESSGRYKNNCFYIRYLDGSKNDFSYLEAIKSKETPLQDAKKAARSAIQPQINMFRIKHFKKGMICPVKQVPIYLDNLHIDHVAPLTFDQLFANYFGKYVPETKSDNQSRVAGTIRFVNEEDHYGFSEYHQSNAVLRILSDKANLCGPRHKVVYPAVSYIEQKSNERFAAGDDKEWEIFCRENQLYTESSMRY